MSSSGCLSNGLSLFYELVVANIIYRRLDPICRVFGSLRRLHNEDGAEIHTAVSNPAKLGVHHVGRCSQKYVDKKKNNNFALTADVGGKGNKMKQEDCIASTANVNAPSNCLALQYASLFRCSREYRIDHCSTLDNEQIEFASNVPVPTEASRWLTNGRVSERSVTALFQFIRRYFTTILIIPGQEAVRLLETDELHRETKAVALLKAMDGNALKKASGIMMGVLFPSKYRYIKDANQKVMKLDLLTAKKIILQRKDFIQSVAEKCGDAACGGMELHDVSNDAKCDEIRRLIVFIVLLLPVAS